MVYIKPIKNLREYTAVLSSGPHDGEQVTRLAWQTRDGLDMHYAGVPLAEIHVGDEPSYIYTLTSKIRKRKYGYTYSRRYVPFTGNGPEQSGCGCSC